MRRAAYWARAHADVLVLVVMVLAVGGANLYWSAHEAQSTGRKFCAVIEAATAHHVPRPADPRTNPARESTYIFYLKFVRLGHELGCD